MGWISTVIPASAKLAWMIWAMAWVVLSVKATSCRVRSLTPASASRALAFSTSRVAIRLVARVKGLVGGTTPVLRGAKPS